LPTTTISCWGEREAQKIMGTEIEYSAEVFRWKDVITRNPIVIPTIIGAEQFHDQNSGRGTNSSQVTFKQLGIKAAEAKRIVIQHSVGRVAEATTEIPGDDVLVKDHNTIIFSMCNLFFEAKRAAISPHKK